MMHPRRAGAAQKFKRPSCGMSDVAAFVAQERQMLSDRHSARVRALQIMNWMVEDNLNDQLATYRACMFR